MLFGLLQLKAYIIVLKVSNHMLFSAALHSATRIFIFCKMRIGEKMRKHIYF